LALHRPTPTKKRKSGNWKPRKGVSQILRKKRDEHRKEKTKGTRKGLGRVRLCGRNGNPRLLPAGEKKKKRPPFPRDREGERDGAVLPARREGGGRCTPR